MSKEKNDNHTPDSGIERDGGLEPESLARVKGVLGEAATKVLRDIEEITSDPAITPLELIQAEAAARGAMDALTMVFDKVDPLK